MNSISSNAHNNVNRFFYHNNAKKMQNHIITKKKTEGDRVLNRDTLGEINKDNEGQVKRKEPKVHMLQYKKLSKQFRRRHIIHKVKNIIKNKDTNGDKVLSGNEFGLNEKIFDKIDKDGNGQIDRRELGTALTIRYKRRLNIEQGTNQETVNEEETGGNQDVVDSYETVDNIDVTV